MAYLRRGSVPIYYDGPDKIILTELDGMPFEIGVASISCFEEHSIHGCVRNFVTIYYGVRQKVLQESFDTVLAKLGEKAVTNA